MGSPHTNCNTGTPFLILSEVLELGPIELISSQEKTSKESTSG